MYAHWINTDDPVFDSPGYQGDLALFNVLNRAIRPNAFLRISDGKDYIIARNRADLAAWIWTSETIADGALGEIESILRVHFAGRKAHFTCKNAVANRLRRYFEAMGYTVKRTMDYSAYRLDRLNQVKRVGTTRVAGAGDFDTLLTYNSAFHYDCFGHDSTGDERETMPAAIEQRLFWVLEMDGRIASFVRRTINEQTRTVTVNQVYTQPEFRGHGCAKQLVSDTIKPFIQAGYHAELYADSANPISNAAYRGLGFSLAGQVLEVEMTNEERTL